MIALKIFETAALCVLLQQHHARVSGFFLHQPTTFRSPLFGGSSQRCCSRGFAAVFDGQSRHTVTSVSRQRRRTRIQKQKQFGDHFPLTTLSLLSSMQDDNKPVPRNTRHVPNEFRRSNSKRRLNSMKWVDFSTSREVGNETDIASQDGKLYFDRRGSRTTESKTTSSAHESLHIALRMLQFAQTQQDVLRAGRILESVNVEHVESRILQDRVIKAAASAGLVSLALQWMQFQWKQSYLASEATYVSVCLALRRLGRLQQLEHVVLELGRVAQQASLLLASTSPPPPPPQTLNVVALNILLSALCKSTDHKNFQHRAFQQEDASSAAGKRASSSSGQQRQLQQQQQQQQLDRAWYWLSKGHGQLGIQPDATSFATVLNAAAASHNQTLVHFVWNEMSARDIHPDIYCYNARLRSILERTTTSAASATAASAAADEDALKLLDELLHDRHLEDGPDPYTIHWLLLPLVRTGRVGDLESYLNDLIQRYPSDVVSDAFAAFFVTLIEGGEIATARALFDTYVHQSAISIHSQQSNDDDDDEDDSGVFLWVPPQVRHFNVLIDGYRQLAELFADDDDDHGDKSDSYLSTSTALPTGISANHHMSINARREGVHLYHMLLETDLQPDSYTLTSVLGLCAKSTEIAQVFAQAVQQLQVDITPAVLRATMTAFGKVHDAASACWVMDEFNSMTWNTRTWNVLLGALTNGAKRMNSSPLDIHSSVAATLMPTFDQCKLRWDKSSKPDRKNQRSSSSNDTMATGERVSNHLQGLTCVEAVRTMLNLMNHDQTERISSAGNNSFPRPNSQSYCLAATALQHGNSTGSQLGMELFRNATQAGVAATDWRFVNAVLRCFGDDIDGALAAWTREIRRACLAIPESQPRSTTTTMQQQQTTKNLLAAYHGLLFVCGRALRPDIGVRLVYAMAKEGIEPNEIALKCYQSGKRLRQHVLGSRRSSSSGGVEGGIEMARKFLLVDQYESLLYVECTKYDQNDRRRFGEQRVRIIV